MIRFLLILLFPLFVQAKQITVAVIDTGFDYFKKNQVRLCPTGHKDFSGTGLNDISKVKHGTNVSGLIDKYAKNANYCQLIYKFYGAKNNLVSSMAAFEEAIAAKVDIINYSAGGVDDTEAELMIKLQQLADKIRITPIKQRQQLIAEYNFILIRVTYLKTEREIIQKALNAGIYIVVAAGNENSNLEERCNYFPACHDYRLIVVGNLKDKKTRHPSSNYGNVVNHWEIGVNQEALGIKLTGTSQAAAVTTGRIIEYLSRKGK